MALSPTRKADIQKLEDDLNEVLQGVKKIRQEWPENGADTLEIEVDKATGFVEYLKVTWVSRAYYQFKQSLGKSAAKPGRARINERAANRKSKQQ